MTEDLKLIPMRIVQRRALTPYITEFTLSPTDGTPLPDFEPGAHVAVETPSGAMRHYSLVGDGLAPQAYVLAVKRELNSRGGSVSMHEAAQEGSELRVGLPENDFPLRAAQRYLLIAGGIGVTPIYSMASRLQAEGKEFEIIYCSRSAADAAYLDEMRAAFGRRLRVHHDDGDPDKAYDFWDHFAEIRNMHVYCCGPKPLMEAIKSLSGHWPEGRVNFEDFKPVEAVRADDTAFDVTLARSGTSITVPADRSILEAVRAAGIHTTSSCEAGTCGSCKYRLLSGEPDHRDMVLMDEEKDDFIMICVSRAKCGGLVLDL
ncbi:PDR/VanB family oxidoreductase [Rhizobium sp. P007]|jgi:phthalate 4,5-dioxygenase reductase subunit|uniref:PDR/VanB family oxidoreductase n=1 Tax=Rhizobium sp. P007 TaxID=285908 RepID=UPI0019FC64C9|nr:PDR/VanB family oxidoreductase [Rhizobium sp. P007]CAD7045528.1 oxidoreductase [Rhizobium sp. P007]